MATVNKIREINELRKCGGDATAGCGLQDFFKGFVQVLAISANPDRSYCVRAASAISASARR
jgi:hypothetical protein